MDYPRFAFKHIDSPIPGQRIVANVFIIRNVIYFLSFHWTNRVEMFYLDTTQTFIKVQEIAEFALKEDFSNFTQLDTGVISLPFHK